MTPKRDIERASDGGSERLEYFSDAIMAIAITLLVIEIKVPDVAPDKLAHALWHLWPSYIAYALSFCTIGLVWVSHHSLFRRIANVDRPLLLLNLCLIAFVAFLPFSTAVLANYSWGESSGASISVMLYSLNMLLIGLAFLALWVYLYRHIAMFVAGVSAESVRNSIVRSTLVPLAYLVSMGLAFVNTKICYAIWLATTIYIAFGPATRRLSTWNQPEHARHSRDTP